MLSAPIRRDVPSFAQLCVIVRYVLNESASTDYADLAEDVKCACARNRLLYDGVSIRKAIDAVQHVRSRVST